MNDDVIAQTEEENWKIKLKSITLKQMKERT